MLELTKLHNPPTPFVNPIAALDRVLAAFQAIWDRRTVHGDVRVGSIYVPAGVDKKVLLYDFGFGNRGRYPGGYACGA